MKIKGALDKIKEITINKNILYFPGCYTRTFLPDIIYNYRKILDKIGVKYLMLDDLELCCGYPAWSAGYSDDFYNLITKNKKIFKKLNIGKIITNCPICFKIFKEQYNFNVDHISNIILKNIEKLNYKQNNEKIIYHNCKLKTKDTIKILEKIGFQIKLSSNCSGIHGGLKENKPELSNNIAKFMLNNLKTSKIITTCASCYDHLKKNTRDIKIIELSQLFNEN